MSRKTAREDTFKIVYERIMNGETDELFLSEVLAAHEEECAYIREICALIETHYDFLKKVIERYSDGFTFDRVYKVDCAILMVAISEILFTDVPFKVAVNEALELAKTYSSDKSARFINGILASAVRNTEALKQEAENFGKEEEPQE